MTSALRTIWENSDGCAEQYRCSFALHLMSVMLQCYSFIIYRGISEVVHIKEVVDGISAIDKHYIYQIMSYVQLLGSELFYPQILMHYCTQNNDVSLVK